MEHMENTTTIGTQELINQTVAEADSAESIIGELERQQEAAREHSETIQKYIDGVRPQIQGAVVEKMEPGVGGECDGSNVKLAKETLVVDTSVDETIAFATEVREHEDYHLEHDHTAPMQKADSATGDSVVQIGGADFTDTELIEGMTVARTGETFVSGEYKRYKADLLAAVGRAGINLDDVEKAIDQKDLRQIDQAQKVLAA